MSITETSLQMGYNWAFSVLPFQRNGPFIPLLISFEFFAFISILFDILLIVALHEVAFLGRLLETHFAITVALFISNSNAIVLQVSEWERGDVSTLYFNLSISLFYIVPCVLFIVSAMIMAKFRTLSQVMEFIDTNNDANVLKIFSFALFSECCGKIDNITCVDEMDVECLPPEDISEFLRTSKQIDVECSLVLTRYCGSSVQEFVAMFLRYIKIFLGLTAAPHLVTIFAVFYIIVVSLLL